MNTQPNPPRWKSILTSLIGLGLCGIGVLSVREHEALERSVSVAEAKITGSRVLSTKYGLSHEVQFEFTTAPGSPPHTRGDLLGRSNLWSALAEAEWHKAVAEKRVLVRYDPKNPANSAPQSAMPTAGDSWTPIVLGGLLLVGVVLFEVRRGKSPAGVTRINTSTLSPAP